VYSILCCYFRSRWLQFDLSFLQHEFTFLDKYYFYTHSSSLSIFLLLSLSSATNREPCVFRRRWRDSLASRPREKRNRKTFFPFLLVSGVRRNSVRQAANTSRDQASSSERYDGEPPSLQVAELAGEHAKLSPSRQIDVFANHQSFDRMPPKKDTGAANDGDARCVQNVVRENLVHNKLPQLS
jgi:hypothetical protein